jgi:hypothetical protein
MTKHQFFIIENNLQRVGQSFFFTCPVRQLWYKIYLSGISFHWYRTIGQTLMSRPVKISVSIEIHYHYLQGRTKRYSEYILDPYLFSDLIKWQLTLSNNDYIEIDLFQTLSHSVIINRHYDYDIFIKRN